jgi:glucoamylase
MTEGTRPAPGWPGIEARWTTSAKSAVGTSLGDGSRVWFTASHGILNEIYFPEVDTACTRDVGILVSSADGFFSEEKRDCTHAVEWALPGVPAFRLRNSCNLGRYEIEKRVCASDGFDVVLQHIRFTPKIGTLADYRVTVLVSPHLGNHGAGNTGWVGTHKGERLLFARREWLSLAVASSAGWEKCSVGFVGETDAWHDVRQHGQLTELFDIAENGNVVLAGEVDVSACRGVFTLAIGFGGDRDTAAMHARASLAESYGDAERRYASQWKKWQRSLVALDEPVGTTEAPLYRASAAVLKTHMSMNSDGGVIASLSVPWGSSRGDGDLGGYHLVWPRDMVETAGGLLACGAHTEMKAMLRFLSVTQEADGHWPQNMWLNGVALWNGIQLDETAFPILLVDLARREGALAGIEVDRLWPMVRRAAGFVVLHGPASEQDRWEEDAGYSPFTLAVEIAALLAAAEIAENLGEMQLAEFFRDTADDWNACIERWTYVSDTPLAGQVGVPGYYVRIGSADVADAATPTLGFVPIKNHPADHSKIRASEMISADALALVRFGLRAPDDPRIVDTVKVVDALLRTETATGPVWKRYNEDGYGEHDDGSAFDGTGRGRGWPLLAGERAHYELAAGSRATAERLAAVMRRQSSPGGLLPEQVWDAPDIPEFELFNGKPAGSAMPLVWAHAEYVKLLRSLRDARVFDCPPQTVRRYVQEKHTPRLAIWRFTMQRREMTAGRLLRIDLEVPARIRWSPDGWVTSHDTETNEIMPGLHSAQLSTASVPAGGDVRFTFYWPGSSRWEGTDFLVRLTGA